MTKPVTTPAESPWWDAGRHAARRPALLARNRIKARLRALFEGWGFVEVECGQVAMSPGNEAHLHGFPVAALGPDMVARTLYLHTSPEFAAKKLLASGEARIFDFARVFRNRERGRLHAPEFTMLEWYRARESYDQIIADTVTVIRTAAGCTDGKLQWQDHVCDPSAEPERITVADACTRHAGVDLAATLSPAGQGDREKLAAQAGSVKIASDDTWADIFSRILVEKIEPHLGRGRVTILDRYPRCEAALARACPDDPRFAERFEIYACGVELANGFGELTDPVEQRARFEAEMAEKQRVYGERYPIDEDFLSALAQMPEASGVALGFDRLVMLAARARTIDDVLWTPFP
jgi:elongation factor P--(R)-beta-lysine ligase